MILRIGPLHRKKKTGLFTGCKDELIYCRFAFGYPLRVGGLDGVRGSFVRFRVLVAAILELAAVSHYSLDRLDRNRNGADLGQGSLPVDYLGMAVARYWSRRRWRRQSRIVYHPLDA